MTEPLSMPTSALPVPAWPDGGEVAISLTFDVDADAGLLGSSSDYADRVGNLSEVRYGITRGLPRLVDLLTRLDVPATFYVPGRTAEQYPDAIRSLIDGGHEVAHHGYMHRRVDEIDDRAQRDELERGIEAIQRCTGSAPTGYRAPGWALSATTLSLLGELGFVYDSSCMQDDRPYLLDLPGRALLELPVEWSLSDIPYFTCFGWSRGRLGDPDAIRVAWMEEFESAFVERRHVTYTMHPHVMGRGPRVARLARMIETMRARGSVWFARHSDVARCVLRPDAGNPPSGVPEAGA
jgi:peptidoglycan-N-acetylglucosamine deacetylase